VPVGALGLVDLMCDGDPELEAVGVDEVLLVELHPTSATADTAAATTAGTRREIDMPSTLRTSGPANGQQMVSVR
jgi:hypothetical protein